MKLNCDLGEGFGQWKMGQDELIMPHIDMANIACGFHAADPLTMHKTVALAVEHNVEIGAHPSYPDLVGFGRRSMKMSAEELISVLQYQIGALQAICKANNTKVSYVKPHGALYNDMMDSSEIFEQVCTAVSAIAPDLPVVIQALPHQQPFATMARQLNVTLLFEAFADRNYQDNGLLISRSEENAVIEDPEEVLTRCLQVEESGQILSVNGVELELFVDTLCVHSDTKNAVDMVKNLKQAFSNT